MPTNYEAKPIPESIDDEIEQARAEVQYWVDMYGPGGDEWAQAVAELERLETAKKNIDDINREQAAIETKTPGSF
jgi:hypothetical protein